MFGFNIPSSGVRYAFVSSNEGFSCTPNTEQYVPFDTVSHASPDFTFDLSMNRVTYGPGTYLAISSVYISTDVLVSGFINSGPAPETDVFAASGTCLAEETGWGTAMGTAFFTSSVPGNILIRVIQTDTVNRDLAADMIIIRLGDML